MLGFIKGTFSKLVAHSQTFLHEFENKIGVGARKHGGTGGGTPINLKVNVVNSISFTLQMNSSDLIGTLKQKISEKLQPPTDMFRMITAGRELTKEDETLTQARFLQYFVNLIHTRIADNHVIHVVRRIAKQEGGENKSRPQPKIASQVDLADSVLPSQILSKQGYFEQLFDLLNLDGVAEKVCNINLKLTVRFGNCL